MKDVAERPRERGAMDEAKNIRQIPEEGKGITARPRPHRARRRGQRGSIVHRGDSWAAVYRMPNGKQKWEGGFPTKNAAQSRMNEALDSIRTNRYIEQNQKLFRVFCDEWMESAKVLLKPKTWTSYQSALKNWINPTFGEQSLCDIRKADVLSFLYQLLKNKDISRKFLQQDRRHPLPNPS
jgi:hypothetical protein